MPAIVGAIKVIEVSSSSIFNVGDVYAMSPYAVAKTFAGGGSFVTGYGVDIHIHESTTKIYDKDSIDQMII